MTALSCGLIASIRFSERAGDALAVAEAEELKPAARRSVPVDAISKAGDEKASVAYGIPAFSLGSARREQRVERALASGGRLQPRIAQAAVPIELRPFGTSPLWTSSSDGSFDLAPP
jgi:hypothetical protein